jgi:hypothetical protein
MLLCSGARSWGRRHNQTINPAKGYRGTGHGARAGHQFFPLVFEYIRRGKMAVVPTLRKFFWTGPSTLETKFFIYSVNEVCLSSARFIGLSRRASRPAVGRLVTRRMHFQPVSNGLIHIGFSHLSDNWRLKPGLGRTLKAPSRFRLLRSPAVQRLAYLPCGKAR